ncbi:LLM class flavin-dependent oxidoreductase [Streptomyces sp. NPDC087300]|uniref:LLM class flavin-dependent oxidoreductase n=1 Tax=Streptomyces sp. NPDC087300 TaxID=3365780 RepID=UPI00382F1459
MNRTGVLFPGFYPGSSLPPDPAVLTTAARAAERAGFDGFWVPERVTGLVSDPVVALAYAAAVTGGIGLGTAVLTLPGRPPALLAKQLASLDRVSGGRLTVALGLGRADPAEQQAFGVRRTDRAALFDEALPLLRGLWRDDPVTHEGAAARYEDLAVLPKPARPGPALWLGGASDAQLRRAGRLADGWLGASTTTPRAAERARTVIAAAAARAGRAIGDDGYGSVVPYRRRDEPLGPVQRMVLDRLRAERVVGSVEEFAPTLDLLPERLRALAAAGLSTFVLVPFAEPADWEEELSALAGAVLTARTPRRPAATSG